MMDNSANETTQQRYQRRNRSRLRADLLFKRSLRDMKINSYILDFEENFFKLSKCRRRGLIHSILIGEFDQDHPFFMNSYDDFVLLFNEACKVNDKGCGNVINRPITPDSDSEEEEKN